ncbi:hypothetical protein [Streptomyces sp. NPDC058307]
MCSFAAGELASAVPVEGHDPPRPDPEIVDTAWPVLLALAPGLIP